MAALPAISKKLKKLISPEKNPLESFDEPTGILKGMAKSLRHDIIGADTAREMWKELVGANQSHDMEAGKEYSLASSHAPKAEEDHAEDKAKNPHIEAGNNYHREITHYAERAHNRETGEVEQKVQQIVVELQRLIDSSSNIIKAEFNDIATMEAPTEVGSYHVNFFEWMLNVIQTARMKVEDSGAWLTAMQGKKGKRNYWAMFKKHGTSFGMSNERQVATQTG